MLYGPDIIIIEIIVLYFLHLFHKGENVEGYSLEHFGSSYRSSKKTEPRKCFLYAEQKAFNVNVQYFIKMRLSH
jgi:hypothetical protein